MTITINHNHYIHGFDDEVKKLLHQIIQKLTTMGQELDTLKTEVQETTTVIASAVTLIKGLKEKLDAAIASGDPAQLTALSQSLDTSQQELAAAIAANTPAESQP